MIDERVNGAEKQGYFVKIGSDVIGAVHSPEGLQLVYNGNVYPLYGNCWDVELLLGQKNNLFTFYWNGEMKVSVSYGQDHDLFLELYNVLYGKQNR